MYHLQLDGVELVGSSPELLVRVADGRVTVRPIAGTRPRGATPADDARLTADLLADEKERAEHVMLVDLGRNDVGRIARYGSVKVSDFMTVEKYSHVLHIVSQVEGDLRDGCSALDAYRATFPAGTMTGAPKVRAMEIIDELEPERRGPYAGAVGYIAIGRRAHGPGYHDPDVRHRRRQSVDPGRRRHRRGLGARARMGRDREQGARTAHGARSRAGRSSR